MSKDGQFNQGKSWYKAGKSITSCYGTFTAAFINGYTAEERLSKCGYLSRYWNKSVNYTRL